MRCSAACLATSARAHAVERGAALGRARADASAIATSEESRTASRRSRRPMDLDAWPALRRLSRSCAMKAFLNFLGACIGVTSDEQAMAS